MTQTEYTCSIKFTDGSMMKLDHVEGIYTKDNPEYFRIGFWHVKDADMFIPMVNVFYIRMFEAE